MSERDTTGSSVLAFIAGSALGAAAGALTAILMAPRLEKAKQAAELAEHEIEAAKAAWKAGKDAWQKVHDGARV